MTISNPRTLRFAVTTALVGATVSVGGCQPKNVNTGPQEPIVNEGPQTDPTAGTPTDGDPRPPLDVQPTGDQTPTGDDAPTGEPTPEPKPPTVIVNPGPQQKPPTTPRP